MDFSPFINCLNTEDCDIPIRAGDDWGAYQYRTTIDVSGTEIESYADFKAGEALIESTLEDSPIEDINLTLSQSAGSVLDDFDPTIPLDCTLTFRDYDLNATVSNTVFYHKSVNLPDDPSNWSVIVDAPVVGSQLLPDATFGTWQPTEHLGNEFHIKCEVTITDPGPMVL